MWSVSCGPLQGRTTHTGGQAGGGDTLPQDPGKPVDAVLDFVARVVVSETFITRHLTSHRHGVASFRRGEIASVAMKVLRTRREPDPTVCTPVRQVRCRFLWPGRTRPQRLVAAQCPAGEAP